MTALIACEVALSTYLPRTKGHPDLIELVSEIKQHSPDVAEVILKYLKAAECRSIRLEI
jgi:hypothetical protein